MVNQPTRWLLTRELADAKREISALKDAGIDAVSIPCIERAPLPWPRWQHPANRSVLFLTSRWAAQQYLSSGDSQTPLLIAATSPATDTTLEGAGRRVDVCATGGAEGLAQAVIAEWESHGKPTWSIRYPTSDAGLESTEQTHAVTALSVIGTVERHVVYRTAVPSQLGAAVHAHTRSAWAVTFSSPSAVKAFLSRVAPDAHGPRAALCFGASTVDAWNTLRPQPWPAAQSCLDFTQSIITLEHTP